MFFCVHSKNYHSRVFLIILINNLFLIDAFNLETRLPLVKRGISDSYFGYSVAAHQIRNENGRISEGLILVGAPLDQNLQPNTNHSGALWKCPLTNDGNDCTQVITDGRRTNDGVYQTHHIDDEDLHGPGSDEIKNGQWLGVTVKSQGPGGKILVCAHRYVSNHYSCRGLCYVLKQNLEFEKSSEPCQSLGDGHMSHGSCQSGTSGLIFSDDNVVIGSPGALNWRGVITIMNVDEDEFRREKETFTGPNEGWSKISNNAYLGMSVAAGYFLGDNTPVFAAGAPRGNKTGQVALFVKRQSNKGGGEKWQNYQIINGEQIASNFGYQIAAADLNGDKLTDLIVAAPFYFNTKTEEGGAVYVYINDPVHHLSETTPVKLTGKRESRFGLALSTAGDLNADGFEDLAIGAPYEGDGVVYIYLGSRNGLITKPSQVIKSETISTFSPLSTFGYSLSGGVDLDENGYPDLLIGAYANDTVVLLRARPIIGFTTKVQPEYNLTNIDPNVRNCLINNTNYISCFSFETCCTIKPAKVSYSSSNLLIKYQLEAESFEGKPSRIWFDDFYSKSHLVMKNLTINNNKEFCEKHTAYLKENTLDIQSPIRIRMSYKLIHKEPEPVSGKNLPSLENYPILNQQEADKIFEVTFLKDCGRNDVCESQLLVVADLLLERITSDDSKSTLYQLALGERKHLVMNVSISNKGESAYQAQLYVHFPKQITFNQAFLLNDKNRYICHPSLEAYIICTLGNPLKQGEAMNLQIEFGLENVNGSESLLQFDVIANTTSNDLNKNLNNFKINVTVVEKVMLLISGRSTPEEIPEMQNIEIKGESAMVYKEEIGSKVTHQYTIYNNGSWNVSNLLVEFEWPYQVANDKEEGKWLLYLDEDPIVQNAFGHCELSRSNVNPLKLRDGRSEDLNVNSSAKSFHSSGGKSSFPEKSEASSNGHLNRVKRDTEVVVKAETYYKDGKKYKIVKMNCLLNSAKCLKFNCSLDLVESKQFATIIIKSRLWEATLIEDYSDVDQIKIASRMKMHIPTSPVTLPNIYSDELQIETIARVKLHGQQATAPIPIYFIIVAILIGLLLFILLTLLLWKLGFFKRRRPDPTLSGNLEKHKLNDNMN